MTVKELLGSEITNYHWGHSIKYFYNDFMLNLGCNTGAASLLVRQNFGAYDMRINNNVGTCIRVKNFIEDKL